MTQDPSETRFYKSLDCSTKTLWRGSKLCRRSALMCLGIGLAGFTLSNRTAQADKKDMVPKEFETILQKFSEDYTLSEDNRAYREAEFLPTNSGLETAPISATPSDTKISSKAEALIIASEVSSEKIYKQRYQRPVWPKGKSGVTVGVGYDVGYATKTALRRDWKGILQDEELAILSQACGALGSEAEGLAKSDSMRSIIITWENAKKQYTEVMQPRYVGITERALENFGLLGPNARGAIVSLVYNRGPSFSISPAKDVAGRYEEMRSIKRLMKEKRFSDIPEQLERMVRIWDIRELPGLHQRRYAEAALFRLDHP